MTALKGLRINNPQALMASYGLLRLLDLQGVQARLHWGDDNVAALDSVPWPQLVEVLSTCVRGRDQAPELNWQDKLSARSVDDYRTLYRGSDQATRAWLDAYWYLDVKHGRPTCAWSRLDLTARKCRVSLCASIRAAIQCIAKPQAKRASRQGRKQGIEDYLRAALLEPWANDDDVSSVGWDPGAAKLGAVITGGREPSAAEHRSVAAAMWLAWEAMPLFPARWIAGARAEVIFLVPHRPTGLAGARMMVLSGPHLGVAELAAQGWSKWRAQIWTQGDMAYFGHARTLSEDEKPAGSRRVHPLAQGTYAFSPRKLIV